MHISCVNPSSAARQRPGLAPTSSPDLPLFGSNLRLGFAYRHFNLSLACSYALVSTYTQMGGGSAYKEHIWILTSCVQFCLGSIGRSTSLADREKVSIS